MRRCGDGRHRDPRHRARGVPRRQRRRVERPDACADQRRGLGQARVGIASWEGSDSLSAWDGDRCVGHVAGYRFDTLVPGGAWLPTSGVTRVGVLSTHRRRGLLRELLSRLLTEAADRGQVLASLRASETRIYQRFGFGLAGRSAEATITLAGRPSDHRAATGGTMRLLRPDEILPTVVDVYDRAARRPGVLKRPDVDVAALSRRRRSSSAVTPSSSPCTRPPTASTTGGSTTA